jgi:outer membrane protein TolC
MKLAANSAAEAAAREAAVPSFTLGLHFFAPVGGMPVGWGASLGMSLPWLWRRAAHRAESARARARESAAATDVARLETRSEASVALAAVKAAERRLTALRDRALPAARRGLEATEAGYAAGGTDILMWLDAERGLLEVEIDLTVARGDLERALADLDGAVGERVPRVGVPTPEKQP